MSLRFSFYMIKQDSKNEKRKKFRKIRQYYGADFEIRSPHANVKALLLQCRFAHLKVKVTTGQRSNSCLFSKEFS